MTWLTAAALWMADATERMPWRDTVAWGGLAVLLVLRLCGF